MTEPTSIPKIKTDIIDVNFGVPQYMQAYWDMVYDKVKNSAQPAWAPAINESLNYNHGVPSLELEKAIIDLHGRVGNAETHGKHLVVGMGASQIVAAVGYAAGKKFNTKILLEPPHWGRLEWLLNMGYAASGNHGRVTRSDMRAIDQLHDNWFKFTTSPNNPDGALQSNDGHMEVSDLCYNWPQYTPTVRKANDDVMIFGLSKATGHAGTRIGWALVESPVFANAMREYVEFSTCGLSDDAQAKAVQVMFMTSIAQELGIQDCFEYATYALANRWKRFLDATRDVSDFEVVNSNGMFAWCRLASGVLSDLYMYKKYGINVASSLKFGMSESNYFRINLGCDATTFEQMIKVLSDGN